MKSWASITAQIQKHQLPLKVERYNMSNHGTLVRLSDKEPLAYTVKVAAVVVRAVKAIR